MPKHRENYRLFHFCHSAGSLFKPKSTASNQKASGGTTGFFYFSKIRCLCFCLLLAGCAASYHVIDVIDLPPPRQVEAARQGNQITVQWRAGSERRHAQFSGYKLFVANHSLATTPLKELPPPFWLPDTSTVFSFTIKGDQKLFIHIRSCAGKNEFSLPSLPEVVVPEKRDR